MRPTAARLVRQSVFVAVFAAPMLVAACGNPLAPADTASRVAADAGRDSTGKSGGSQPWYDGGSKSGGSQPWYDGGSKSGGSQPWYDGGSKSGGSQPWY